MDIKDLNKPQLIMLALLLCFVTSIATGIVTITLMQQAPTSITMPINRVVRQTVEKIVPAEGKNTVQTVIIKEEDLVVDAVAKNQTAMFSVTKEGQDADGKTIEIGAGQGFAVSNDGIIAVDGSLVTEGGKYYLKNGSGKFNANFISLNKNGFALLKVADAVNGKDKISFTVPNFGDLSKMKAGQKIIILGNTISSFMFDGGKDIKVNTSKSNAGSMILNLDGDMLGIALSGDTSYFAPSDTITEALKAVAGTPSDTPATPTGDSKTSTQ